MTRQTTEPDSMPRPGPSEWGKLNAGQSYGVLAVDFGRAVFGVAWGKYELPIVYYVMEHSWGVARRKRRGETWPDPHPCHINFYALSKTWNFPRQRLYEARDYLKAANFLLEDEDGFWINKNAHEWVNPKTGEPLLSPQMLNYAFGGRSRSEKSDKEPSDTPQRDNLSQSGVTGQESTSHGAACQPVTVERDNLSRPSVTSPIEERAQDSETLRDCTTHAGARVQILKPTPDGPADPKYCPPYPGDSPGLLHVTNGPHKISDADARAIFNRLWLAFGRDRVCNEFYSRQQLHSVKVWNDAIQELKEQGKDVQSIELVHLRAGDIEVRKPKGDRPRPAAKPEPARMPKREL